MVCPFCGETNDNDSLFCVSCGCKLEDFASEAVDDTKSLDEFASGEAVYDTNLLDQTVDSEADYDATTVLDENKEYLSDDGDSSEKSELSENIDPTELLTDESEISDIAEENFQDESPATQEPVSVSKAAVSGSFSSGNARMSLAVIMLSAALLAITGFLFIDKLLANISSDKPATTIRIISQSEDIKVKAETNTEFFVDADGTNLSYQWYVRKNGEQMWHVWKNHNDCKTSGKANESWDGMQVYCMITDNNRTSVASEIITISIEK